jgi:hypothetical protein
MSIAAYKGAGQSAVPGYHGASVTQASDHRADGQRRQIEVTRDCVRIDRRLHGIAMRVAVPVQAYRGVALSLRPETDGTLTYQLNLLHKDDDLSVALDVAEDDRDIVADWRLWSRFFRLPALVERQAGVIEEADASLGGLAVGAAATLRRRSRFRSKRRPAFLKRRKVGVASGEPTVHADEREIIARG